MWKFEYESKARSYFALKNDIITGLNYDLNLPGGKTALL